MNHEQLHCIRKRGKLQFADLKVMNGEPVSASKGFWLSGSDC